MKTLLLRVGFLMVVLILGVGSSAQSDLPGYIAVIGEDHNVYVVGGAFAEPFALTSDARQTQRYQFPTWSTDGRLAFFCCDLAFSGAPELRVYAASSDLTAAKLLYSAMGEGYTYGAWSPANCIEGQNCRELAVLVTRPTASFKVELIRQRDGNVTSKTAASGAPFYFSWNRDGNRMLWHRNNNRVSIFDSQTDTITDSTELQPLLFQAPAWSPVDDRSAVALTEGGDFSAALTILEEDGQRTVLRAPQEGLNNFSWSPDGRYIAYRVLAQRELTAVQVFDTQTGDLVSTSPDINVLSFFWSPDGRSLAYITPDFGGGASAPFAQTIAQQDNRISLVWNVLDIETGQARGLVTFMPTRTLLYLMSYFDQFNQSHQLWSPDSRYLVYPDLRDSDTGTIVVLDVETGETRDIMSGDIAIWSYK